MKRKTALMIGGGILLLGVGFFIFKRIRDRRKYSMPNLPNESGQGNTPSSSSGGGGSSSTSTSFDPSVPAKALYESMKGFGTDEDKFFNTARSLTASQREAVKNFYNTKYGDLKDWITGDFSFGEEDEALKLFNL